MVFNKTDEETNETQLDFEFPKIETKPGDVVLSRNGKYYFAVPAKESERCDNCAICDDYATDAQCPYKALCSCFYRADFQSLRFEEATNIVDALSDKILREANAPERLSESETLRALKAECTRIFRAFADRYEVVLKEGINGVDEKEDDYARELRENVEDICIRFFNALVRNIVAFPREEKE